MNVGQVEYAERRACVHVSKKPWPLRNTDGALRQD